MRRGLLAWSPAEVSEAEFGRRLSDLRSSFADYGLDALLVYSNFARTGALSYLTNVVPFWSEAMLIVPASGPTTLVVGLPNRDVTVIRPTGCLDDLICDPDIRNRLVTVLGDLGLVDKDIGILGAQDCPALFAATLEQARGGIPLIAVGNILDPINDDGSSAGMQLRAAEILRNAISACSIDLDRAETLVAIVELQARLAGAEEVQVLIAPDLTRSDGLRRIEGQVPLGQRFAIAISIAYKGHWVRAGRSINRNGILSGPAKVAAIVSSTVAQLRPDQDIASQLAAAFGDNAPQRWSLEAVANSNPLTLLAHSDEPQGATTRMGQLVVLTAWFEASDGMHYAAATARIGDGLLVS